MWQENINVNFCKKHGNYLFSGDLSALKKEKKNMLRIVPNGYQAQPYSKQPAFKSHHFTVAELNRLNYPGNLEAKVARLSNDVRTMFNETRAKLRKSGKCLTEPQFHIYNNSDGVVTLKSMPNSRNNGFVLEFDKGDYIDRIFVEKNVVDNIKYERAKKTSFGTAVIKHYDVKKGDNNELTENINERLKKYLSHFLLQNERKKTKEFIV